MVLGAQWGDEGKGKLVDLITGDMDMVCRCLPPLIYCSSSAHAKDWIRIISVVDPKLFFSDLDPTFQEISDPDPAQLLS